MARHVATKLLPTCKYFYFTIFFTRWCNLTLLKIFEICKELKSSVFRVNDIVVQWNNSFQNGTRRRTPGGVYFFLLKRDGDVSQEMINQIFTEDRKETQRKIKRARAKSRQTVMEQLKQSLTGTICYCILLFGEGRGKETPYCQPDIPHSLHLLSSVSYSVLMCSKYSYMEWVPWLIYKIFKSMCICSRFGAAVVVITRRGDSAVGARLEPAAVARDRRARLLERHGRAVRRPAPLPARLRRRRLPRSHVQRWHGHVLGVAPPYPRTRCSSELPT